MLCSIALAIYPRPLRQALPRSMRGTPASLWLAGRMAANCFCWHRHGARTLAPAPREPGARLARADLVLHASRKPRDGRFSTLSDCNSDAGRIRDVAATARWLRIASAVTERSMAIPLHPATSRFFPISRIF